MSQIAISADSKVKYVAVAGNPNCGKTTIFNGLTGMRLKVANYPGVTVERREGRLRSDPSGQTLLIDMPGTYSLAARSLDERIARDVLLGWQEGEVLPDAVIVVLDASNLERNLYLASQILDLNLPVVFLCNMMDIARQRGMTISLKRLSKAFGVPVIPTIGNKAQGLEDIAPALQHAFGQRMDHRPTCILPEPIEQQVARLGHLLVHHNLASPRTARGAALLLLLRPLQVEHDIHEALPAPVEQALHDARVTLAAAGHDDLSSYLIQCRYEWLDERLATVIRYSPAHRERFTERMDHVLTHKVFGVAIFALVMFAMFAGIFWLAEPAMRFVETSVTLLQGQVHTRLPRGALSDMLADGVVAGVGNIVVFFPQICLLFLFIAVLEDTGYMARAAFLMDRIMRRVGLHGRSFIPLLSSLACAVPGILATRTIENRRDRLATVLVAPLMCCSARLPVYFMLIALIFPGESGWTKAGVLATLYLGGTLAALGIAALLKKTVLRGPTPTFIMELPPYRLPDMLAVLRTVWDRGWSFLARAGTFILAASIVLWAIFYWPRPANLKVVPETHEMLSQALSVPSQSALLSAASPASAAARQMEYSLAGRLGKFVEPAIRPLGYDWRVGVGVIASFTAREIFVSTMGIVYSVNDAEKDQGVLRSRLHAAVRPDGTHIFSKATCLSLLVFYALATQCISTLAVAWRETGSWRWPVFLWLYTNVMAYVAAWIVYHVTASFGLAT